MTVTAIIPFFRYEPVYKDNYKVLFHFFILQLKKWINLVDEVIIVDSGCNFTKEDFLGLESPKIIHYQVPPQSHWQNMNEAVKMAKSEYVLLLDSDMIVYNEMFIQKAREKIEKYNMDGLGIFDSSGSRVLNEYPLMWENENRAERRRFCPYLFFLRKSALREDFDFTPLDNPGWTDSMGKITYDLLEDGKTIGELPDDRSTISLEDDGEITSVQWLDTPPYAWSMIETPNYGYYHVRNFGGALSVINNFYTNKEEFEKLKNTMPRREVLRLLAWFLIMAAKTNISDKDQLEVGEVIAQFVDPTEFADYLANFAEYYKWLERI